MPKPAPRCGRSGRRSRRRARWGPMATTPHRSRLRCGRLARTAGRRCDGAKCTPESLHGKTQTKAPVSNRKGPHEGLQAHTFAAADDKVLFGAAERRAHDVAALLQPCVGMHQRTLAVVKVPQVNLLQQSTSEHSGSGAATLESPAHRWLGGGDKRVAALSRQHKRRDVRGFGDAAARHQSSVNERSRRTRQAHISRSLDPRWCTQILWLHRHNTQGQQLRSGSKPEPTLGTQ